MGWWGEVVVDLESGSVDDQLHASPHASERAECGDSVAYRDAGRGERRPRRPKRWATLCRPMSSQSTDPMIAPFNETAK